MPSWYRDPNAPTPNRPRRLGVLFVIELGEGVLLDRRSDDGSWAFTGGRIERDDAVLDALHRELGEETGLTGTPRFLGVFSDPTRLIGYPDGAVVPIVDMAFVVSVQDGAQWHHSHESDELRLFTPQGLREVDLWPIHHAVRDAYFSFDGTPVVA